MAKKITKTSITENPLSSNIQDALLKKALGYEVSEVVEEYSRVDKDLVLMKRKVSTKAYPPDLDAIELALGENKGGGDYENLSDDALLREQQKLMEMFKKLKKE